MSDLNPITVSFDEMSAVRVADGLRLKASFRPESSLPCGTDRCTGCEAGDHIGPACFLADPLSRYNPTLKYEKHCMPASRKDRRCVTWVPA